MKKTYLYSLFISTVVSASALVGLGVDAADAARFNTYNAASDTNRIVLHRNQNMGIYDAKVTNGMSAWYNAARPYEPATEFPRFVDDVNTTDPVTVVARVYNADDGLRGYYDHNPGTAVDYVNINTRNLSDETDTEKTRTVVHELGHASGLGHPNLATPEYCTASVMIPSVPCSARYIYSPGSYDKESIQLAPRRYSNDLDTQAKEEFTTIKGKKVLTSKTVDKANGGVKILEYDLPNELKDKKDKK